MGAKTDTQVVIRGKIYTLSGYESEEYLQKVALYINNKYAEYNKSEEFTRQSADTQSVLLELNIADDYFKAREQIAALEEELTQKKQELSDVMHDLIDLQMRTDNKQS
ncbi:MAG: cell division protein ZapA [Lachnospiraceae bacterium]|nr:cell division protein ZapA [Lachnospiraceae bacterium]